MFSSTHIAIVVAGARLNLAKEDGEKKDLIVVETNLVIEPWPAALLRELGDEAAAHVFLKDGRVKPELKTVKIRPTRGRLQRFAFSTAIDGTAEYSIEPVIVQFMTFHRKESEKTGEVWAKGIIRVDMEFRDKTVRTFLANSFGDRRFLSTVGLEGRLNFEVAPDDDLDPNKKRQPRLVEAADEPITAPPPDPAAGDVLDETGPEPARTQLHTGRDKSKPVKRSDVH